MWVTDLRRVTVGELHVHCEDEEVLPNHRAYTTHIAARKDIDDYIDSGWLWWVLFKAGQSIHVPIVSQQY